MHVLGIGPTQWASPEVADAFRHTFGSRAAQLAAVAIEGRVEALIDPMTLCTNKSTIQLHNFFPCEHADGHAIEASKPVLVRTDDLEAATRSAPAGKCDALAHARNYRSCPAALSELVMKAPSVASSASLPQLHPTSMVRALSLSVGLDQADWLRHQLECRPNQPWVQPTARHCAMHLLKAELVDGGTLQRTRTPEILQALQESSHYYWTGNCSPDDAFAIGTSALHRGESYRKALLREHWRLKGFVEALACETIELPLVMRVDNAWDCCDEDGAATGDRRSSAPQLDWPTMR